MEAIKQFKKEDLLECTELYIKVFNDEPWNDNWSSETAYIRLHNIFLTPNFEGIVYIEDGRMMGAILGNYEQFYDGVHYNLREMFVSKELQGTGIGSKMLNQLEEQLKTRGVTTIILFTSKGTITSKFYLKNGFSEWTGMAMMGKDL